MSPISAFAVEVALARDERVLPGPDGWAYEPKFDGWRARLCAADRVVVSRAGRDLSPRFMGVFRHRPRVLRIKAEL